MSASLRRSAAPWAPEAALLFLTTAVAVWAGGRWVDCESDMGRWWSIAYRLGGGERLYRDVYFNYGPLSPYLLAGLGRVFGISSGFILLVTWIPAVVAALLLLLLARPLLSVVERLALVGVLLASSLFAPGPGRLVYAYAPAAVHGLALALGALALSRSPRPSRGFAAGVLAGLAFCAKQELGLAAMAAIGCAALVRRDARRAALAALGGFAAMGGIGAAAVLMSAPPDVLRRSYVWPLVRSVPPEWSALYRNVAGLNIGSVGRVAAATATLSGFAGAVSLAALALTRERRLRPWAAGIGLCAVAVAWVAFAGGLSPVMRLVCLSMTIAVVTGLWAILDSTLACRAELLAVAVFAALVGSRAAFSSGFSGEYMGLAHFASSLTWVVFLCRLLPSVLPGGTAARPAAVLAAVALLVASVPAVAGGVKSLRGDRRPVDTPAGRLWLSADLARFFGVLERRLPPGERVWLLPQSNGADAVLRLREASPYSLHIPGWLTAAAERELVQRLEQDPPRAVVIFTRPTDEYGVKPFGEGYGLLLAEWVKARYVVDREQPGGTLYRPRR